MAMIDASHWGAVLAVDDDLDFREAVAEVLESLGHRVFTAMNGREALRQLQAELQADGVPRPCLILLDWMLPPPAGPEFLAKLGALRDASELSVIVVTASPRGLPPEFPAPVRGVLRKPFDIEDLLAAICQRRHLIG